MKKIILAVAFLAASIPAFAGDYVNGYTRSNGTQVQGYYRSSPNNTVQDNYSYQGNTNPYTGSTGNNRYEHDTTSPYYNGTPYNDGRTGHSNSIFDE